LILVGAILLAIFVVDPPLAIALVLGAAIVEIGETFFWVWLSQRWRIRMGPETLIGERAEVVVDCRPEGQVRLQGELWRARCLRGADAGRKVRVTGRDGLTLLVEPE
jgi:membrane protein implicated in regulation of membrane protease activity